jgi:hypothetical protein
LKPEALEFLTQAETLVAWAVEHQELIALDEIGLTDDEDDE